MAARTTIPGPQADGREWRAREEQAFLPRPLFPGDHRGRRHTLAQLSRQGDVNSASIEMLGREGYFSDWYETFLSHLAVRRAGGWTAMLSTEADVWPPRGVGGHRVHLIQRGVTIVAQSNPKQVEALSEVSDIIVQISDEDLTRMESLAQQIARFDHQLGDRITEAYTLLTQLNDDVEMALERLEPDVEEDEEIEVDEDNIITIDEDEDLEDAEAEAADTDANDEEDEGTGRGKGQSKRKK
jgi:hypothetical protein